ncbi:SGNH hydrolase [Plenodomus tracheiphilus IPT5]|uniref:SGNH hydrolase n=1 Tax=Plenodomus tracheiphilus IPT5 TaxID=1408161 RepID=A0A6A7BKG9_9PLEO|nr:SGNH hydrolase [Plenodomus tracheiphilus IPT5]
MSYKHRPVFVLFGDSLTEWSFDEDTRGFGLFLREMYEGRVEVVNEGQAGYTSTRLKPNFTRIITRTTSPTAPPTLLFTIFLGANDACIIGDTAYIPWPEFESNMRMFIETILTQDAMPNTKIVLIGPPPINAASADSDIGAKQTAREVEEVNEWRKGGQRYKTYVSKKRYAEGMMGIAGEYGETGRVVGLDFWREMVDALYEEEGGVYDEELPPGSGLLGAKCFGEGWFTDGLHLDVKGYAVLSKALFELVTKTWPELAPERLEVV